MSQFKVGDLVRCKKEYSNNYTFTNKDALCKVVYSFSNGMITVTIIEDLKGDRGTYEVKEKNFEVIHSLDTKPTKGLALLLWQTERLEKGKTINA